MQKISQRVLDILEWPAVLDELVGRCDTGPGASFAREIAPLDHETAGTRLRLITDFRGLVSRGDICDFSGVEDIEGHLVLAEKEGVLRLEDLLLIREFIFASGRVRKFLQNQREEFPPLAGESRLMDKLTDIGDLLISAITDAGRLSESKYPKLKGLNDSLFSARQEIEKNLNGIIYSPDMDPVLQEKMFNLRNGRYVLLVKANMKGRIKGTVHDVSSTGATLYVEPAAVTDLNNAVIVLNRELNAETERILRELSRAVARNADLLRNNLHVLACLDFLQAAARFSIAVNGSGLEIANGPEINLVQARHPLLSLMIPGEVVPNDIALGEDYRCLILSGANTGGKTVLLKTIALCALMAAHGLHIPASPDSRIGIFDDILADIGDDQNLSRSLSTFSGQITIIHEMINRAGKNSLIILDEIIVGTNPRQGAALAQAILEQLIETGSIIVVTTHYSELKELPAMDDRFQNGSVSFDTETLRPTYRLRTGIPGISYAIEIAKNYGLGDNILDRSRELLSSREISVESLIEQIQKYEEEMEEERVRLDRKKKELLTEKEDYEKKRLSLQKLTEEIKHQQGIDFLEELAEYRRAIADKFQSLQSASMGDAGKLQEELISVQEKVTGEMARETEKRFLDRYGSVRIESLEKGKRIFIVPLEKEGIIENFDTEKETVSVRIGSLRSRYRFKDLLMPKETAAGKKRPRREKKPTREAPKQEEKIPVTIQTSYNTVDLRGMLADEAVRAMEDGLDRMLRSGISAAVVIHGHGTGALKKAVRERLKHSPYAEDFRPGGQKEGGDGVTIVRLA